MIQRPFLLTLLGLTLLSGCLSPSPAVTFHTLSPLESTPAPTGKALAVEVLPVQLPELLQRSQIVILKGPGSHRLSATHRWGNTLEKDMQRVLAENLSALLGSDPALLSPEGERGKATYRIFLDVQQCDGALGGSLQFRATWTVTRLDAGHVLLLRKAVLQEPVNGQTIEELVSAHNRIMDTLSREIATALLSVAGDR